VSLTEDDVRRIVIETVTEAFWEAFTDSEVTKAFAEIGVKPISTERPRPSGTRPRLRVAGDDSA
jgi:hypothetical protein